MSATIFSHAMKTDNLTKDILEEKETTHTKNQTDSTFENPSATKETTSSSSQTFTQQKTRIPVPSSTPLRRSFSLRVKGDKKSSEYSEKYRYFNSLDDSDENICDKRTPVTTITTTGISSKHLAPSVSNQQQLHRGHHDNQRQNYIKNSLGYTQSNPRRTNDYMQWRNDGSLTKAPPAVENSTRARNGNFAKTKTMSRSMTFPSSTNPSTPTTSRQPPPSFLGPSSRSPRSPGSVSSPRTPSFGEYHHRGIQQLNSGHRSGSCSLNVTTTGGDSWETESMASGVSGVSLASTRGGGECDHASVARNGTTFSGRSMKYVFHCNQHAGQTGEDYLTPTQRAHKQVRLLKALLREAQNNLEQKDSDIVKLTKEVVELRLYKAALGSPEDKSNSSDVDVVTVRENDDVDGIEGIATTVSAILVNGEASPPNAKYNEMNSSYTDSGNYDDYTSSSVHSKDSILLGDDCSQSPAKQRKHLLELVDRATSVDNKYSPVTDLEVAHRELVAEYERRLNEMKRSHDDEQQDLKRKHTEKVEELLLRITEINTRYWELVPELDSAKERIKELEQQLDEALKKLEEQEEKHNQTFLQMYHKGQDAQQLQHENQLMEMSQRSPKRISVSELLHQLQVTQTELENLKAMYRQLTEAKAARNKIDPEITLQFLKSAIYYFLTDKENNQGHLKAIQSILGFTPSEIQAIEKARLT